MTPSEIRRKTAEKMTQGAKPAAERGELDLPPGGQAPDHIVKRLQAIRARCAASVAAREPETDVDVGD